VNIFGGIVRCDLVAEGILDALTRIDLKVPMVVRLDGTNAPAGRKILEDANIDGVESSPAMWDAAKLAVERARG
jgi:succinyl-CoA synthetase beta subunit